MEASQSNGTRVWQIQRDLPHSASIQCNEQDLAYYSGTLVLGLRGECQQQVSKEPYVSSLWSFLNGACQHKSHSYELNISCLMCYGATLNCES